MRMNRVNVCTVIVCALAGTAIPAMAQTPLGTAFVYQGELSQGGSASTGTFDIRFRLFDALSAGNQVGTTLCLDNVAVSNGRFTAPLDFGSVFAGDIRFLEIEVRADTGLACDNSVGYDLLSPRQVLSPAPGAIFATSAGSAVTAASATNAVTASNALSLGGQPAASFPLLSGNNVFTGVLSLNNPSNILVGSGAAITGLNASNLSSGTLPSARLTGTYSNALTLSNAANAFSGSGAGLVSLNASYLSTGTLPSGRLEGTYSNALTFSSAANSFTGVFTGDGAELTGLNANAINSGTIGAGRLPNSVVRTNISNAFGAFTNTFAGNVGIGTLTPATKLTVRAESGTLGFEHTDGTRRLGTLTDVTAGWFGTLSAHPLYLFANNSISPSIVIGVNGRVGFGTSVPQLPFEVRSPAGGRFSITDFAANGTSDQLVAQFQSESAGPQVRFESIGVGTFHDLGKFNNDFVVEEQDIRRITLKGSTGNLGIGQGASSPTTPLSFGTYRSNINPTLAIHESGTDTWSGFGREMTAMTFWSNGQVQARLRDDGMFEVKAIQINGGADLVERFDSQHKDITPGTLMVIDPANPGQLMPSSTAYDTKVAGIISGAGGVNPGIHLSQKGVMDGEHSVAMTGRVYVKCTTDAGAITPGDLLTTSDVPGHAMRASDHARRPGAVIGKAMTGLDKGNGLVLVLVNLQ